ncbi:MAG: class I SAM-dependent methyltransferase [Anaerolineales bacterium]|nr:class I SAM-dependent methyltransferase [Anaerolineales bacterium]
MTAQVEKIHLNPNEETLLITLYTKARLTPPEILADTKATELLERIDYDYAALKVPTGTRLTVPLRAKRFDEYVREFLAAQPEGTIIHLGCGLDTRIDRIRPAQADWYDLDLPEVIDLRRNFFVTTDRYHMIACDVTDLRWMDAITAPPQKALVVAEGLFMYLAENQVKQVILGLQEHFPGCHIAFDAFSQAVIQRIHRHPSVKHTGATICWGIDEAKAIESWGEGIRLVEEWYFNQSPYINHYSPGYRLMFKLSGLFPAATKAHRLLYYTL